jgi:flagellum-specific peptidoglycan hydrolase FlgJ
MLGALAKVASKVADVGKDILKGLLGTGQKIPKGHQATEPIDYAAIDSSTKILGAIFMAMQRARTEELAARADSEKEHKDNIKDENTRNEELIKALTVRRKPKKKKAPPKEAPAKKEKPKPEPKAKEPEKAVKPKEAPKPKEVTPKAEKAPVKEAPAPKAEAIKPPPKEAPPKAEPAAPTTPSVKPSTAAKITTGAAIAATGAFSSPESFAKTMAPEAEKASKSLGGVPANALLGQWALESGWGKSVSGDYNYFGIKAQPGYSGDKKLVTTREVFTDSQAKSFVSGMPGREIVSQSGNKYVVKDWFRSYKSIGEAVEDKVNFLKSNKRYSAAGVFDAKTPEQYFSALQKAGYATDPNYVSSGVAMAASVDKKLKKIDNVPSSSPAPIIKPSTGTKIDQASKENKDMKESAATAKKQQTVNNTTVNQTNTQSASASDSPDYDDRNPYQKKKG